MIAKHVGCKPHQYQDKTYGNGFRVMNPVAISKGSKEEPGYRCTVCAPRKVPMSKRGGIYRRSELIVQRG